MIREHGLFKIRHDSTFILARCIGILRWRISTKWE